MGRIAWLAVCLLFILLVYIPMAQELPRNVRIVGLFVILGVWILGQTMIRGVFSKSSTQEASALASRIRTYYLVSVRE